MTSMTSTTLEERARAEGARTFLGFTTDPVMGRCSITTYHFANGEVWEYRSYADGSKATIQTKVQA